MESNPLPLHVEVFVGGEEGQVDNFIKFIKEKNDRPKNAKVESIEVVDEYCKGNIRTIYLKYIRKRTKII